MWKRTTKEICVKIREYHKCELEVFGSNTDLSGYDYEWSNGCPEIMTEWGFKGAKNPLYKVILRKKYRLDKEWNYEYYFFVFE